MCSSSSRNFANSSRRAAARQHAVLRLFTLSTLHAVLSGTCHLMTHGSNLTWWVLLCRCDFLPVSRRGSKLQAGKTTQLKGGGVRETYKLSKFSYHETQHQYLYLYTHTSPQKKWGVRKHNFIGD